MRTSHQQFEKMTAYMEQYGDLSKPANSTRGRVATLNHWDELTTLLNSDGSGHKKTTEKWKKAWSDLKNNTKKKAARLHRAASGTAGPAVYSKITDLERRILNLTGVQVGTGVALEEDVQIMAIIQVESPENTKIEYSVEDSSQPGPSNRLHVDPLSPLTIPQGNHVKIEGGQDVTRSPSMEPETVSAVQPDPSDQTETLGSPRRDSPLRNGPSRGLRRFRMRRRPRPRLEETAQRFLNSDREWRQFRIQQHRDYMEMKREQSRIRVLDFENQRDWRAVVLRSLDVLEKLVINYRRD